MVVIMKDNRLDFIKDKDEMDFVMSNKDVDTIDVFCPYCVSKRYQKNGTYVRKTIIKHSDTLRTTIQKYICKDCRKSFSTLPNYLTSYSHITTLTLSKILLDSSSINHLSLLHGFSRSSIRYIKNKFNDTMTKKILYRSF